MNENFRKKQLLSTSQLINIPIIGGTYYDGSKIFTYKASSFWPLMFTIFNLPPNLRKQYGAGLPLIGLFESKTGTPVENFLIRNCFCEELNQLDEGYTFQLGSSTFFIQVRYNFSLL